MSTSSDVGRRLREARLRSGYVIDDIAAMSGMSRAYISQVETGKASPSLQTVEKLADALKIPMATLFVDDDFGVRVTRSSERQVIQFGAEDAPLPERKLIHFLSAPDRSLELVILEIPVGFAAGPPDLGHEGEEAFFVLEGRVKVIINSETHILEQGDSVHWSAALPHQTVNVGNTKAKLVFARTPAGFMDLRFTASDYVETSGEAPAGKA